MKKQRLVAAALLFALQARAGPVQVEGDAPRMEIADPQVKGSFIRLLPDQILSFTAVGPSSAAFRMCQLFAPDQAVVPLDVTVIRDQQQQGTVRARMQPEPSWRVDKELRCSAQILLAIDVPAGKHSYHLIITGSPAGVALAAAERREGGAAVVEATPAGDRQPAQAAVPLAQAAPKRAPPVRQLSSEIETIASPAAGQPEPRVRTLRLRQEGTVARQATRVVSGLAGIFLVSTAACLVSAGALEYRAHAEPVQVEAGRLHAQARRAWEASAVMGALTGVATVAALSLIWQRNLEGEALWGIFRF